jgi:uncharacterized membrane protein
MRSNLVQDVLIIVTVLALPACNATSTEPAAPSMEELRNATYHDVVPVPVMLADGRFEGDDETRQYAPRLVVTLADNVYASGDLTGDGVDEAVALLAANFGGSGVFGSFVIVGNDGSAADHLASISLGDRARVTELTIRDGVLVADLVVHGPDDPMCCPTQAVRREWRLEAGQPVEITTATTAERFRGHLVWGHESRSFSECGEGRSGWVVNETGDELVEVYEELTSTPYQPMFVEVRGTWSAAPEEGFGADYAESLTITELLRAEGEGFGCRLDLDGVLYIANGNEPSWRLVLREDQMTLRTMTSPDTTEFALPRKSVDDATEIFDADGPEGAIRVALERRRCTDSMSGARFAFAALVEVAGRRLHGCALQGL